MEHYFVIPPNKNKKQALVYLLINKSWCLLNKLKKTLSMHFYKSDLFSVWKFQQIAKNFVYLSVMKYLFTKSNTPLHYKLHFNKGYIQHINTIFIFYA